MAHPPIVTVKIIKHTCSCCAIALGLMMRVCSGTESEQVARIGKPSPWQTVSARAVGVGLANPKPIGDAPQSPQSVPNVVPALPLSGGIRLSSVPATQPLARKAPLLRAPRHTGRLSRNISGESARRRRDHTMQDF